MSMLRQISILTAAFTLVFINAQEIRAQEKKPALKGQQPSEARQGEPYYLPNCPVSGEKLGSMGDPVVKVYDGREVRFCCDQCPPKFEKDKVAGFAKIDAEIIKDQLPLYPLKTSVVSGKAIPNKPLDFVYANRLVRLVDNQEKENFLKEPNGYLEKLNKAVTDQGKNYPLKTCVVSDEKLGGEMGKPVDVVMAGRLIRLCCNNCKKDLEQTPAKYIAKVDAARGTPKKKEAEERHPHGHDHKDQSHDH